jgi:hypothetical protein
MFIPASCALFNDTVSIDDETAANDTPISDESKRTWKEAVVVSWSYCSGVCLEELKKTTNNRI